MSLTQSLARALRGSFISAFRHQPSHPKLSRAVRPIVDELERRVLLTALPSFVHLSSNAAYNVSTDPNTGATILDLNAGSLTFDADLASASGWQGVVFNVHDSTQAYFNSPQTLGGLNIGDSARVTVSQGSPNIYGNLLDVGELGMSGLATLDLTDNAMVLRNAGWWNVSGYVSQVASGYASGLWNGPGIDSSAAAEDTRHNTAIGIAYNGDMGFDTFDGSSVGPDDLMFKYTLYGDADLSGKIDATDSSLYGQGVNGAGTGWEFGDFNYDGQIDSTDQEQISNRAGQSMATNPAFARALSVNALPVSAYQNVGFSSDVATFTDSQNPSGTDPSIYTALVSFGDGNFSSAQVTADTTAGSFRVNVDSGGVSDPGTVLTILVQYADPAVNQARPASVADSLNVLRLPLYVNPSGDAQWTFSGTPGAMTLDLTAGSFAFDTDISADGPYWQNTQIDLSGSAHAYFNWAQTLAGLSLADTSQVSLAKGTHDGSSLTVNSLSIGPDATLDLSDNGMYIPNGGTSAEDVVREALHRGYANGAWNGTGLTSSTAAADGMMFGYLMDWNLDGNGNHTGVEVGYTLAGDTNLDASVDNTDIQNANLRQPTWFYGDFNYDGVVDSTDFNLMDRNYGTRLSYASYSYEKFIQPNVNLIQPIENVPFTGQLGRFQDTAWSPLDPSDYRAMVVYGDGVFHDAQVIQDPNNSYYDDVFPEAGGVTLSNPDAMMTVVIGYADMWDPATGEFVYNSNDQYTSQPTAMSEPITLTPAVQDLTAVAARTSEIDLAWTLNAPNATGFEIDRSTNDGTTWQTISNTLTGTATAFADSGLLSGTHYSYRLAAIQPSGNSAFTTSDAWTFPSVPAGLTVSANGGQNITLTWNADAPGVTGVVVERSSDGVNFDELGIVDSGETTFVDDAVTEGTHYTYRISALNDSGQGNTTSGLAVIAAPLAPTDVLASAVSGTEIDLYWDTPSAVATSYTIQRSDDGGATFQAIATTTGGFYQDTSVDPEGDYTYQVESDLDGENSDPSPPSETTAEAALPGFSLSGSATAQRGSQYTLDLNATFPPNTPNEDTVPTVAVDWGDGQTLTYPDPGGSVTHVYDTRGHFTISAQATYRAGTVSGATSVTVGASDVHLDFSPGSITMQEGGTASFTASLGGDGADFVQVNEWVINWDDGSGPQVASGGDSPDSTADSSQDFSHSYGNGGTTFQATVTAFTDQGPVCAVIPIRVTVTPGDPNHPDNPPIAVQNDANDPAGFGPEGQNPASGGSNAGGQPHQTTYWDNWCLTNPDGRWTQGVTIDWGDGQSSGGTTSSGGSTSNSHGYNGDGQYYVTVTDGNGNIVGDGWVRNSIPEAPTITPSPIPDQIVATGDAVDVSATASHMSAYHDALFGYVNWGDGTGLWLPSSFQSYISGAVISGHLDHAGAPGTYAGALVIDRAGPPGPVGFYGQSFGTEAIGETFSILVSNITVNIDTLPADQKMDPGAFVPINDNYDSDQDVPDDQLPVPDITDPQLVDASVQLGGPSGASVKWHLDFPSSVNVYEVNGSTLTPLESGSDSSPLTLSYTPTTISLKIEGLTADDNALLQAVLTPIAGQITAKAASDQARAVLHELSMKPYTEQVNVDGSNAKGAELDLTDEAKRNAGAFVPVNKADEAYSLITNGKGQTTGVKFDKDVVDANKVPVPIPDEDELLAIVLHAGPISAIPPSAIKFQIPGFLRMYQNPDRSGMIKSNTAVQMTHDGDYMFYVEGTGPGSGTIDLSGQFANNAALPFTSIESLKITAFEWTGAVNVPQFGTYQYNVPNNPQGGQWLAPVNGTMALHGTAGHLGANKSNVDISWGAGPVVGGAIYQASTDFTWRLEVNVVQVTVDAPEAVKVFDPGNVYDNGVSGERNKLVTSKGPTKDGLSWAAKITVAGPTTRSGWGNAGIDLMQIGFVQNLKVTAFNGTYSNSLTDTATAVVGFTFWDTFDRSVPGELDKTYSDKRYSTNPHAVFDNASSSQDVVVAQINSFDDPGSGPPLYLLGKKPLISMSLIWDLTLFVTATTRETVNDASKVYVAQALAQWRFNGSGALGAPLTFPWTGVGAGITPPAAWSAPPPGTRPRTDGSRFNDLLRSWQLGF